MSVGTFVSNVAPRLGQTTYNLASVVDRSAIQCHDRGAISDYGFGAQAEQRFQFGTYEHQGLTLAPINDRLAAHGCPYGRLGRRPRSCVLRLRSALS